MSCITIKDGAGKGNSAKVDGLNRLSTKAVTESTEHFHNHDVRSAYSIKFSVTPTGAGDCFLYLKNTSEGDLIIEGMGIHATSNEAIDIYLKQTGTPAGGTTNTPVNLNTATNNVLDCTVQTGADITGLSNGTVPYRHYVPANNSTNTINFESDIIISSQQTFCLYAVTGAIALDGYIDCFLKGEFD